MGHRGPVPPRNSADTPRGGARWQCCLAAGMHTFNVPPLSLSMGTRHLSQEDPIDIDLLDVL